MKNLKTLLSLAVMLAGLTSAHAASHTTTPAPMATGEAAKEAPATASADMSSGEVRKVDMGNKKVTLKHGEIKNLDMPGMTMVFQVRDPAMLDKLKAGDKVRFRAEKAGGAIVVTDIELAR